MRGVLKRVQLGNISKGTNRVSSSLPKGSEANDENGTYASGSVLV